MTRVRARVCVHVSTCVAFRTIEKVEGSGREHVIFNTCSFSLSFLSFLCIPVLDFIRSWFEGLVQRYYFLFSEIAGRWAVCL